MKQIGGTAKNNRRAKAWCRAVALVGMVFLSGCGSTSLRSTWVDEDYGGGQLKKIAVFVLHEDANLSRFAEDQAARVFPRGTQAIASYKLFDIPEQDVDKVKDRLAADGFDGALMARTISVDKSREYVPSRTVVVPTGPILVGPIVDPVRMERYYTHVWGHTYQTVPGYVADTTTVVIESVLYVLPEGRPIWSAVSESRNARSGADLVQELVALLEKQLSRKGLIGGK